MIHKLYSVVEVTLKVANSFQKFYIYTEQKLLKFSNKNNKKNPTFSFEL